MLVQFEVSDVNRENRGVIEFLSKTLSAQEQRQTTTEREALAVFYCICKCEFHLRGRKFVVHTDHKNLKWIQNTKSAKVERWRTYLSDFEFELEYVPGKKNIVADTLSRIGHREVSLQPGEVIKELSNSEADAEILEWRPAHVEARGTPLVGDYPQVPVRDFFEDKKASDDLTPKHVTFICGNVPAKRVMTLQAKEVSPVATTSDAGEKVVASPSGSHDTREKWIDKIRASQKKHLDSVVWD
ncbi:hypothetical protein ADUPG1_005511, partial [Aduncisulcus paluster]